MSDNLKTLDGFSRFGYDYDWTFTNYNSRKVAVHDNLAAGSRVWRAILVNLVLVILVEVSRSCGLVHYKANETR